MPAFGLTERLQPPLHNIYNDNANDIKSYFIATLIYTTEEQQCTGINFTMNNKQKCQ